MNIVKEILEATKDIRDDKEAVVKAWEMKYEFCKTASLDEIEYADRKGLFRCKCCRFCYKYNRRGFSVDCCFGCPIRTKVNREGCGGTPYMELSKFLFNLIEFETLTDKKRDKLLKLIHDEIDFLKSL